MQILVDHDFRTRMVPVSVSIGKEMTQNQYQEMTQNQYQKAQYSTCDAMEAQIVWLVSFSKVPKFRLI